MNGPKCLLDRSCSGMGGATPPYMTGPYLEWVGPLPSPIAQKALAVIGLALSEMLSFNAK